MSRRFAMGELYTVKEASEMLGITPQALYKRLYHNKMGDVLLSHISVINGKKFLDEDILEFFLKEKRILEKKSLEQNSDPISTEVNQILSELTNINKKKLLKAAKQILEVQKYE